MAQSKSLDLYKNYKKLNKKTCSNGQISGRQQSLARCTTVREFGQMGA